MANIDNIKHRLDPGCTLDMIRGQLTEYVVGAFKFVLQNHPKKHHGNVRLWVLNGSGEVIDDRTYYDATGNEPRRRMVHKRSILVDSREALEE